MYDPQRDATEAINVSLDSRLTNPTTHNLLQGDGTTPNQPVFAVSTSQPITVVTPPAPTIQGSGGLMQYFLDYYKYVSGYVPPQSQDKIVVELGDFYRQDPVGNHLTPVNIAGNIEEVSVTVHSGYESTTNGSQANNLTRGADNPMFGIGIVNAVGGPSHETLAQFLQHGGSITYEDKEAGQFDELLHAIVDTHSTTGVSLANASGAIIVGDFTGNAQEAMNSTNRLFPPGNHGYVGPGLETISLIASQGLDPQHQVPIAGVILDIHHV
jgi:hypothetical protein